MFLPEEATTKALVRLIADLAIETGTADSTYIVGGAVRDAILQLPVKDIDVVVVDIEGGKALRLAREIASEMGLRDVHPDQYGVIHVGPFPIGAAYSGLYLSGEKVEIVTARSEKYDKSLKTGSHKPTQVRPGTLEEDLRRRDFTIGTLAWKMSDIPSGDFEFGALPVIDQLGGLADLRAGVIRTPLDPRETFEEDPSRLLRAVRFAARFNFKYDPAVEAALSSMSNEMARLPYEALDLVLSGKILPLPLDRMIHALEDLLRFGLLVVCLKQIPASRLRRVVDGITDVRKFLALIRFGFPSALRGQLTPAHFIWLYDAAARNESDEYLRTALARFIKPPNDIEKLMVDKQLVGPAIRKAVELARQFLLQDPFMEAEALDKLVREAL